MSFWTAIVVIVLICAIASVMRSRQGSRDRHRQDGEQGPSPRETQLKNEVEELRERIHVLEKITVDGREARAIADEIESLREEQKQ